MLGIAVFAAVAAVGTFLSWAISNGYLVLGPTARVVLGLTFAAGVGVWGSRLRARERSFGSSLVGLALVIVLVCAFAAGPSLHLVPTWLAFVGSAGIAWGLAVFARSEDDEPLWCVAFGGAAIAPFVASDGSGNFAALLAYGFVLLLFGCFGIGHRRWPVAWRVFYASSALICLAVDWLARVHGAGGVLASLALPLAVGAAGVLPFAPDSSKRAVLRWLALLTLVASLGADNASYSALHPSWTSTEQWSISATILGNVALWLSIIDGLEDVEQSSVLARTAGRVAVLDWIDVALLPLLFTVQSAEVVVRPPGSAIVYGLAGAMLFSFIWRRDVGSRRDAGAFAFLMIAAGGMIVVLPDIATIHIALLLSLTLFALVMHALRPSRAWVAMGAGMLIVALLMTIDELAGRATYAFPPFATIPSLLACGALATMVVVARFWRSLFDATCEAMGCCPRRSYARGVRMMLRTVVTAPWVWAFLWVLIELSMVYSASTSTLLLVTYFATTAVASVAAGHARNSARVRQVGLGLAVIAAGTAVYGASTYFNSGIRIVAYLVTSAFLLGIAYWYRQPGNAAASA